MKVVLLFLLASIPFLPSRSEDGGKVRLADFIPEVSSTSYIMPKVGTGTDGIHTHSLSLISARLNPGGIMDFYVAYDVIGSKFTGYELTLRPRRNFEIHAGLMRLPFIQEITCSPRYLEAIGFSSASNYLGSYGQDLSGINSRGRDFGLLVRGSLFRREGYDAVEYNLGVFNGNGYEIRDNDSSKDIAGRLVFHPSKAWTVSLGGMHGRYRIDDGRGIAYEHAGTGAVSALRQRFSTALWYDNGHCFLRSENVYGSTDGLKSNAFSILTGYWITGNNALSVRYDHLLTDTNDRGSLRRTASLCITHMCSDNFSIRMQYDRKWGHAEHHGNYLNFCFIFRLMSTILREQNTFKR